MRVLKFVVCVLFLVHAANVYAEQSEPPILDNPFEKRPKVEPPQAETPTLENPFAEKPKVEQPKVEPPQTQPPKTVPPGIEVPKVQSPRLDKSKMSVAKKAEKKPLITSSSVSAALGINFRNKQIFSQESYFQDSWLVAVGGHWDLSLWSLQALIRGGFERFQLLPRDTKQLGIETTETRLSLEAGLENRLYLPLGASLGIVRVGKSSKLISGEFISDQSSSTAWSDSAFAPSYRIWVGVPLWRSGAQLNACFQQVFVSQPADEKTGYGAELRVQF